MQLVLTDDFETVKSTYVDVIANTPGIAQHAKWRYGHHPDDALLKEYIDHGEMYLFMDGETVAGVVAVTMYQGDDYKEVHWKENLADDEVAAIHLLAVSPACQGCALGQRILKEVMALTVQNGKKALRLDTLLSNIPAQRMYERAGFSHRGGQQLYIEHLGMLDFVYYEKIPAEA